MEYYPSLIDVPQDPIQQYLLQDLKEAAYVKFDCFVEAVLGVTSETMQDWIKTIGKKRWCANRSITAGMYDYCYADNDAQRYDPLSSIVTQIMALAPKSLTGVPHVYPVHDICTTTRSVATCIIKKMKRARAARGRSA